MAKRWRRLAPAALTACAIWLAGVAAGASTDEAGPWRDLETGLAIGGYDPVAYFTEGAPKLGLRVHELALHGAAWRFESAANRAVFEHDPDVYAPRFGGHDPLRLADGFLAAGNPFLWAIIDDRLFLFVSADTHRRWLDAGEERLADAEESWSRLAVPSR